MTNLEFLTIMETLDVNKSQIASILGVTPGAVVHWVHGRRDIPEPIARLMRFFEDNPDDMEYFKQFRS